MEDYNRFNPKSKATSSRTYQHDHMQPQLHGLFYLGFAEHKLPVYDFKIPLKSFKSSSVVDLIVATLDHVLMI